MHRLRHISLTEGPLLPSIVHFSIPLMLSNVLQVLFNMSDIAVVGRFAGSAALGAVGSTTILVSLFTGFLIRILLHFKLPCFTLVIEHFCLHFFH